jgi:hypothetical protein
MSITNALRLLLVFMLLSFVAASASAECSYWECRRTYDTSECWERFGPSAPRFRWGTGCDSISYCMTTYSEVWGWTLSCSYDCCVTNCYEV